MARVVTFGRMPTEIPEGNFIAVRFPELAKLDTGTNEGWISRVLSSDGADTRSLPRTISFQELDTVGHDLAAAVGSVWEVTVDGETGIMSGRGFLADDEWGHKAALAAKSKKLHHNSVDLAEVTKTSIEEEGDYFSDDYKVTLTFEEWKFGKTTIVALPAFADANMEIDGDELKASLVGVDELIIDCPGGFSAHSSMEIVASMSGLPRHSDFYRQESDIPHKVMLGEMDENGYMPLYGHLARWGERHTGIQETRYAPRSRDNYATFCQPGVLTDGGIVNTGPIVLFGGHVSLKDAADDPANAWADVRVIDGKHGPWLSGIVRPHITEDAAKVYIARASRLSGHWKGDTLRMIVSVNAEGFTIPAETEEYDLVASFSVSPAAMPSSLMSFTTMSDEDKAAARSWVMEVLSGINDSAVNEDGSITLTTTTTETVTEVEVTVQEAVDEEELTQAAIEERARLLAEGGLADLLDWE